jgi:hypothetical protein
MLALEGGARLRPQRPDDLDAFLEPVGAVVLRAELEPQHGVLVLGPAGADAELQPPAGQVVDRDGHLRQHRGMAVGVADDSASNPGARRQLRHRRQHRPGLEDRAIVPCAQRGEVVHHPAAVETGVVGETPEAAQLVDGRVLTELEPEPQRSHPPVISLMPHLVDSVLRVVHMRRKQRWFPGRRRTGRCGGAGRSAAVTGTG